MAASPRRGQPWWIYDPHARVGQTALEGVVLGGSGSSWKVKVFTGDDIPTAVYVVPRSALLKPVKSTGRAPTLTKAMLAKIKKELGR